MVHLSKVSHLQTPSPKKSFDSQINSLRTLARSRQLEAEEQSIPRHAAPRGEFFDDLDEQANFATLIRDDQIDFLDPENEYADDDGSSFGAGGDDEEAINLNKQRPPLQ